MTLTALTTALFTRNRGDKMTATARQNKPDEFVLMIIRQDAEKAGRDPDDIAREMFGRPVAELTEAELSRLGGRAHLLAMDADKRLKECAFCGAPTITSKCPVARG
jgi:hypothetical protein